MGFLEKIENFINLLLIKLTELVVGLLAKAVPSKVKLLCAKVPAGIDLLRANFKQLPQIILAWLLAKQKVVRTTLRTYDYKSKLNSTIEQGLKKYKASSPEKIGKARMIFLTPFLVLGDWLKGLSTQQAFLLITFSGASFLALLSMIYSGQRIAKSQSEANRLPASVEAAIEYDRPLYYKKQLRHLEISNFRLPVYFAQLGEVVSVDVDFVATVSNRNARLELEKYEFQLRDHLIHSLEPSVGSFPLEDEGKEIIKGKLEEEINSFMQERKIIGSVLEVEITYVLAN